MDLPSEPHDVLLLHNPRCSKSRATHALLEERGIRFRERRYLEEPLTRAELEELGRRLGRGPGTWIRRKEAAFAEAGLAPDSPDDAVLEALARHPVLMERPIVVRGEKARIGRPPEDVLELFPSE